MLTSEAQSKFRPRRRHQKSRNGCLECKRRRIKCNETKPSCSRCILTLQDCIYPAPATSDPKSAAKGSARENDRPPHLLTPSPHSGLSPSSSSSFEPLQLSPEPYKKPSHQFSFDTSESGLYHHYLQHTSRTLTDNRRDFHALQICMPTLALRSKTVYHSILALSAACMCSDMINSEHPADVSAVSDVLMTGYRHYNQASERLRELISRPNASNAEPLLAAPPLLVPFATSSQQINHWISSRSEDKPFQKLLTSTPRDVIILSRGISATIRALQSDTSAFTKRTPIPEEIDSMDNYISIPATPTIPPSHNHPMFPIIKQTSEAAFSKLQERIDWAFFYTSPNDSLSACAGAFDVLSTLRSAVFPSSTYHPPLPPSMTENPSLPPSMTENPSLPQVPPWLVSFTARPSTASPTEHMTRPFLSFLVHTPQKYLDLVLPLLDKRLEGPSRHSRPVELSVEEALALDIYAHWSVLMFLVEEESWWVGNLPNITLSGMIHRYGDGFVPRFWPGSESGSSGGGVRRGGNPGEWWPSSMLKIEREIGRYR